jgi:hypothetical protein
VYQQLNMAFMGTLMNNLWPSVNSVYPVVSYLVSPQTCSVGQDSVVGIATRYGLDGLGIESW